MKEENNSLKRLMYNPITNSVITWIIIKKITSICFFAIITLSSLLNELRKDLLELAW